MIFTHRLSDQITDGLKTVTRRPCESASGRRFNPPAVGDLLPIQRGYTKAHAHAHVTAVERQDAFVPDWQDDAEARREGFPNGEAFWLAWRGIYGDDPVDVWRIEFLPPGEKP